MKTKEELQKIIDDSVYNGTNNLDLFDEEDAKETIKLLECSEAPVDGQNIRYTREKIEDLIETMTVKEVNTHFTKQEKFEINKIRLIESLKWKFPTRPEPTKYTFKSSKKEIVVIVRFKETDYYLQVSESTHKGERAAKAWLCHDDISTRVYAGYELLEDNETLEDYIKRIGKNREHYELYIESLNEIDDFRNKRNRRV